VNYLNYKDLRLTDALERELMARALEDEQQLHLGRALKHIGVLVGTYLARLAELRSSVAHLAHEARPTV
jgi:hypothetical protein